MMRYIYLICWKPPKNKELCDHNNAWYWSRWGITLNFSDSLKKVHNALILEHSQSLILEHSQVRPTIVIPMQPQLSYKYNLPIQAMV